MEPVPHIVPISAMHNRSAAVLDLLTADEPQRPIYLAQRSHAVAVLVSVAQWDAIAHELHTLRAFKATHSHQSPSDG